MTPVWIRICRPCGAQHGKMFVSERPIVDTPTARGVVEDDLKTGAAHAASGDDPDLLPPPSHEDLRGCFGGFGRQMVAKGPECLTSILAVVFVTPFQCGVCKNRGDRIRTCDLLTPRRIEGVT